jgi:hypothetical protein
MVIATTEIRHASLTSCLACHCLARRLQQRQRQIRQGLLAAAAPPVNNPIYNPYAAYGEANATWQPPVFNRDGTIVKPAEPASQADRPPYEFAPWATAAAGGNQYAPPGTF